VIIRYKDSKSAHRAPLLRNSTTKAGGLAARKYFVYKIVAGVPASVVNRFVHNVTY
jgi:hypothetical protein